MIRFFLFLTLLLFFSCSREKTHEKAATAAPAANVNSGKERMVERLHLLINNAVASASLYTLNTERAQVAKAKMDQATDPTQKVGFYFQYAEEILKAGKTKEAITAIEDIFRIIGNNGHDVNADNKPLYDLLGLACLRLGEQDNCIANHTGSSCIIPISNEAVHKLKTGSERAIEIYTEVLQKFPDDYSTMYLLNVAYMTLGQFPDGVPQKWRLPKKMFATTGLVPHFNNIAGALGLEVNGHAGGSGVEDFNGDGYLDIIASSMGIKDQLRYFQNNGDGTFKEKTSEAGLTGLTGGLNLTLADYNNDGLQDVFVLRGGWAGKDGNFPNSLLKNNGDGTFEEVTIAAGIFSEHPTQTASWADFDLDGDLDVFIGNESFTDYTNPCEMYVNNGNGTFTESAAKLGLNLVAFVKGCGWGDVNRDGLPDLYLSCVAGYNKLYMNRGNVNGTWKFEEIAEKAGVKAQLYSFPTWFWDYDNDGWEDIFVSGYDLQNNKTTTSSDFAAELLGKPTKGETLRLFHNNGNETFKDVTAAAGMKKIIYTMGSNYGDINNDGYLDCYLGTGKPDFSSIVPNVMFLNRNGKYFTDVNADGGFGHIQKGHGVSFADFDQDGDLDIYEVIGGAFEGDNFRSAFFENPGNGNHAVTFRLQGTKSNKTAVGAIIKVDFTENGKKRTVYRKVSTGGSFGCSPLEQMIGLGQATKVESVTVTWPNKDQTKQTFTNLEAGKKYLLTEDNPQPTEIALKPFVYSKMSHEHHHHH